MKAGGGGGGPPTSLEVPAIVAANIVSVVGVVMLNKMVYRDGFTFPTALMCLHFLCTWLFVTIAERMRWFTEKRIHWQYYAKLGAAQVGSVAFVNLSLLHNPVSMYQLFKFTNVFMTVLIEFLWLKKTYSLTIYLSLVILVLGVSVASVSQVSLTVTGLLYGLAGSVASAVYQIYNKRIQTEHEVTPLQLLQFEQPFTALFAAVFACFSDKLGNLGQVDLTPNLAAEILGSCVFAFGVNLTTYLIIGKTSPLTFSVVGHLKTIGVLIVGFVGFHEVMTWKSQAGLCLAFAGIILYTHLTTNSAKKVDDEPPILTVVSPSVASTGSLPVARSEDALPTTTMSSPVHPPHGSGGGGARLRSTD